MSLNSAIRPVRIDDASRLLAIYSPYVLHSSFTPVFEVPTAVAFASQIREIMTSYPFLVCLQGNEIKGYAYAHQYRNASGHRWSAETSIYMAEEGQGKGFAKKLYTALLNLLALQGFINVFAGIVLPNERSIAFHKELQFTVAGKFDKGVYKAGDWHDVQWMQLCLKDHVKWPPVPKSWMEMETSQKEEIEKILSR